eukprot:g45808.t1
MTCQGYGRFRQQQKFRPQPEMSSSLHAPLLGHDAPLLGHDATALRSPSERAVSLPVALLAVAGLGLVLVAAGGWALQQPSETMMASLSSLTAFKALAHNPFRSRGLPKGFVSLREVDSSIIQDMRYAGHHNFVGRPISGYLSASCILTTQAAQALQRVQKSLLPRGLSLKVYDCYRPTRAVADFETWAANLSATETKAEFYPRLEKTELFKGYVAHKSGHSRGSTVDLTIVPLPAPPQPEFVPGETKLASCIGPGRWPDNSLDMGTGYDCLDTEGGTNATTLGPKQWQNRQTLREAMEKEGFENYWREWWHFSLKNEPFPNSYFNHPVINATSAAR